MHMADALISPVVGGAMWAGTAGLIAYSAKKVKEEADDRKVPLMGVLGAFIFAAQMINFSIPVTGSSGHLGGGMILAILLQQRGASLGAGFGASGELFTTRRGVDKNLFDTTIVMAVIFVSSLVVNLLIT